MADSIGFWSDVGRMLVGFWSDLERTFLYGFCSRRFEMPLDIAKSHRESVIFMFLVAFVATVCTGVLVCCWIWGWVCGASVCLSASFALILEWMCGASVSWSANVALIL